MVITVFDSWGIRSCEDVGHMVFNLIGAGVFGKTEQDSIEDFKNVYDFEEAFVKPFAPAKPETVKPLVQLPASSATCIPRCWQIAENARTVLSLARETMIGSLLTTVVK